MVQLPWLLMHPTGASPTIRRESTQAQPVRRMSTIMPCLSLAMELREVWTTGLLRTRGVPDGDRFVSTLFLCFGFCLSVVISGIILFVYFFKGGYMKLKRGSNMCGVASLASYAYL